MQMHSGFREQQHPTVAGAAQAWLVDTGIPASRLTCKASFYRHLKSVGYCRHCWQPVKERVKVLYLPGASDVRR